MMFAKFAIVLLALTAVANAYNMDAIIEEVNSNPESTWVAGVNEIFRHAGEEEIKRMLGWKPTGIKPPYKDIEVSADLPESYSVVEAYPNCTSVQNILNQGSCGSCWAFGCISAVSDRFCIASNGKVQIPGPNAELSAQQMTSCGPCDGCEGGDAGAAWDFVKDNGLVSWADYPYTEPTCKPSQQPCEPPFAPTNSCKRPNSTDVRYHVSDVYSVGGLFGSSDKIMQEIYEKGSVEGCFSVYSSLLGYKSGVYSNPTGQLLGGHCIRVVGWGVEDGVAYWLVANSWTRSWGDNGYFKIARDDEATGTKTCCGFQSDMVAGTPVLPN